MHESQHLGTLHCAVQGAKMHAPENLATRCNLGCCLEDLFVALPEAFVDVARVFIIPRHLQ
jgi:hypothetical protein